MKNPHGTQEPYHASPFRRPGIAAFEQFTYIGVGDFGGKALGLAFIQNVLEERFDPSAFPGITVSIPRLTVLRTSVFDSFMRRNELWDTALADVSDDRIAHAFQRAHFPAEFTGDLMAMAGQMSGPLAVRSSSRLEDALVQPFAGVYETKMIPNNESTREQRFAKLISAIKFVFASMFFSGAKAYMERIGGRMEDEKMAVIIQEVVGTKRGSRYYPTLSGVGRSFNYYPTGRATAEQGVVNLALGLGKTIVDGGVVWTYCPAWPRVAPPAGSARELVNNTQTDFWAVNMDRPNAYDPIRETEYLVREGLAAAEEDGAIKFLASTWDPASGQLRPGIGHDGPRVLDFAPLLQHNLVPLNKLIRQMLELCEEAVGEAVEIEFAVTLDDREGVPARFGMLQVRPMATFSETIELPEDYLEREDAVVASPTVLGNGDFSTIRDIVYLDPERFDAARTPTIAQRVGELNRQLNAEKRPYLLVGFGRWGSSDPWLGVPVQWSQISGAAAIVEMATAEMDVDLSQGSHFFHNLSAFHVCYFSLHHARPYRLDWEWIRSREHVGGSEEVHHVRTAEPLRVVVDGRTSQGMILHG